MKEYKIAIMGNREAILGFKGLGADVYGLAEDSAAATVRQVINNPDYAVVFITEDWADKLSAVLAEFYHRALPAVVPVPPPQGSTGASIRNLRKIVELAVGSDILSK